MVQPPDQPPRGGFGAPQDRPPSDGGRGEQPAPPAPGGFGAPQDPRQGTPPPPAQPPQGAPQPPPVPPQPGYGYPQPPQPQPGYGYPQQPGPYAQPGPYGAPTAPGGPYAAPQQPGPYGYPPQPGYGQAPYPGAPGTPPPGSRNPFKGRPLAVAGAAVAALLVVGGTVWAVSGDGGGKKKPVAGPSGSATGSPSDAPVNPGDGSGDGGKDTENLNAGRKPGEAKVLWYKEAPDAPGSGADAPGMWITSRTAVKAAYKQVFAYDVAGGAPAWAPLSFPQKICAVTPQKTSDDKAVVAYMSGSSDRAKCNQLQEIDLDTGRKGWHAEVPDGALFDSTISVELSVTGRTLMVGRSQSGLALNVETGSKLFDKKKYGASCFPSGFAGGARLIVVSSCGAGGDNEHDEVQELDPSTGRAEWTRRIPKGWSVERTYSVDPVVLYSTNKDDKHWNISALNADGSIRSQVDTKAAFSPKCDFAVLDRDLQGCQGVAADASTLYLPTDATTGANEIVAIDLATGKEKWRVKSPTDTSMTPVKVEGGQLIAYAAPSYDAGGRIVSVATAGAGHTPVKLLQNPASTAEIENGFYSKAVDWVDGRFYLSTTRLNGNDKTKEKLMLAFGR
ncbi:outer membrane protein assembly factor BamB family protein [Streptomyces tropicalis]|uniref:PQQ-binding-like beta-propeller repeat protein n=1 Tax=Streptomyces tropicalis TaxID=3034234 RepID=A0ABT6ABG6_9ACTN|nr:PQQ-binding-like beta-propeller repeat protein [Streptomyces tropicalis]MDF3301671.1 PQQ-binding-like beta-propeller repeat protein [Streptomyces tropicalis]